MGRDVARSLQAQLDEWMPKLASMEWLTSFAYGPARLRCRRAQRRAKRAVTLRAE